MGVQRELLAVRHRACQLEILESAVMRSRLGQTRQAFILLAHTVVTPIL